MTATGIFDLSAECCVDFSLSHPSDSNDTPFSESCFKTIEYQPVSPGRLCDLAYARVGFTQLFGWSANRRRYRGLALNKPVDVFWGPVEGIAYTCQSAINAALEVPPELAWKRVFTQFRRTAAMVATNSMDRTPPQATP